MKRPNNILKYVIGLVFALLLRVMPHPPNVEPITASLMPYSKKWGIIGGVVFSVLAVLVFDLVTGTLGVWSIMTVGSFMLLAVLAGLYFNKKRGKWYHYTGFAVVATLIYDAITGIGTGVLFFGQSYSVTLMGQIPFTLYHLAGNVVLSALVSPLLYRWVVNNENLELDVLLKKVKG